MVPVDDDIIRTRSAYFEKFPSVFFDKFRSMFDKHILSHWRDEKHLVYMIGGTPSLAKAFLQLLNTTDVTEDEADEERNQFVFEDWQIELRHLQMNGGPVVVDQRQCMGFLTAGADLFVLREDPIIMQVWPLLQKMAMASSVVDIYDPATSGNDDNDPVLDIVHRQIAPHANHQQKTESGVKGIADQSHTGVDKDHMNACSIIHYYFTCEHKKWQRS